MAISHKLGMKSAVSVLYKVTLVAVLLALSGKSVGGVTLRYTMEEEASSGTPLGNILVDSGLADRLNSTAADQLVFSILKGPYAKHFQIGANSHMLKTSNTPLDRDSVCPKLASCVLEIDLAISRPISLFQVIKTFITVEDLNDNEPAFADHEITVQMSENASPGVPFNLPIATDPDSGDFGRVDYQLLGETSFFSLSVIPNIYGDPEVQLILESKLDRETEHRYSLELKATDGGSPPLETSLTIHVVVTDTNDNHPVFDRPLYNTSVPENYPLSTPILAVHAADKDHGDNGAVVYSLSRQTLATSRGLFGIDSATGELFLLRSLDYEEQVTHQLTVVAKDKGHGSVPSSTRVLIHVRDVNDVEPRVTVNVLTSSGHAEVSENVASGQFVAHVSVQDPDGGMNGGISCEVLNSQAFSIVEMAPKEFKLLTNATFDREEQDTIEVGITCSDNGRPVLSTLETVTVTVLDQNDNAPVFTQNNYTTSVRENSTADIPIFYVSASDRDQGVNGRVTYELQASSDGYLKVDPETGLVSTNKRLDREVIQEYRTHIYAIDKGMPSKTSTATIRVIVDDINDEAPVFELNKYVFGTLENQAIGTEIGSVLATDADVGPNKDIIYTLTSHSQSRNVFRVDPHNGKISTKRVLDRELKDTYILAVLATNTIQPYYSATATVSIHVADKNDNAPTIAYPTKYNNTIRISAYASRGTIAQVVAADVDIGKNALLIYEIGQGNEDELFAVNPASGEVVLEKTLTGTERANQSLLIVVEDQGSPPKSAVASLYVKLDPTLGTPAASVSDKLTVGEGLTMEVTIVIIVGCLSVVLAGCLAALLVYLCRRKPQSKPDPTNIKTLYGDIRRAPEDGMEEANATPLTLLAQAGTLEHGSVQTDRDDMWITDDRQRNEEVPHLDSGHGSWAESASDCGTLTLEYADGYGPRGYFRRPVYPEGQEHGYKPAMDQCGNTMPRLPLYNNPRQPGNPGQLYGTYMRPSSPASPCGSDVCSPMLPEANPRSPTYLRPPLPPRRAPTPVYVADPTSPSGHRVCYSMEDLLKYSGNQLNLLKNQFNESDTENASDISGVSSFNSGNSGVHPPVPNPTLRAVSLIRPTLPKPMSPMRSPTTMLSSPSPPTTPSSIGVPASPTGPAATGPMIPTGPMASRGPMNPTGPAVTGPLNTESANPIEIASPVEPASPTEPSGPGPTSPPEILVLTTDPLPPDTRPTTIRDC